MLRDVAEGIGDESQDEPWFAAPLSTSAAAGEKTDGRSSATDFVGDAKRLSGRMCSKLRFKNREDQKVNTPTANSFISLRV